MGQRLGTTGTRVDKTLDEALAAAERMNRLLGGLDGGEKQLARLLTSMEQLAQVIDRFKSTVNVASAVGAAVAPAVAALVRGLTEHHEVLTAERDDTPRTKTKSNGG
jgi:ABC-type transporter Mla subunit MlaD